MINVPHRYDLTQESCVNTEVVKFNRQVKKIMEHQPQVEILELALDGCHFTTHGLHLNSKGKTVVSQNLALVVQQCFNKINRPLTVIPIPWKNHPPVNSNTTIELQDTSISTISNTSNTTGEVDSLTSPIQDHPLSNNNTMMELQETNFSNTIGEVDNPIL
jgi:N-dimethylarginine dimethylaminohydrolase